MLSDTLLTQIPVDQWQDAATSLDARRAILSTAVAAAYNDLVALIERGYDQFRAADFPRPRGDSPSED